MKKNKKTYSIIKSNGFELIQKDTSDFFDDYYDIFSNGSFQIRFSSSKSFETVDIRSNLPNENWYDLALIKALLDDEKNLNSTAIIKEHRGFLNKELTNIAELFNDRNYFTTIKSLEKLGNERAKKMFPGI